MDFAAGKLPEKIAYKLKATGAGSRASSKRLYRERNLIERFFSKLKHFRPVATRYDKLAANFLAMVQLASIRLWLRAYESTT
jgi:transposase